MSVTVRGLDRLQRRLNSLADPLPIAAVLKGEAEAIAEAARAQLAEYGGAGHLAQSVRVADFSVPNRPAFAAGSESEEAREAEFGTIEKRATPFLSSLFFERSRAVNARLRQLLSASLRNRARF